VKEKAYFFFISSFFISSIFFVVSVVVVVVVVVVVAAGAGAGAGAGAMVESAGLASSAFFPQEIMPTDIAVKAASTRILRSLIVITSIY
jgi:hypothetical protein